MYSTHKRMKKTYQLKRNTKRLTNFQKLMLTYLNSQKKLVNKCLSISKTCTCTVIDVNSGGFRSGAQNCKDVESESGVFLVAAKGKMNMFPKDTDVGAMNLSEQEEQDWIQAQDSERPVIGCDEHNVSVCNKVCIMSNVSNDIVEGLETVTESGKPFDQYDKGTFSLVFLTKNRAYVSKFTSENIMTIKEKFATDQAMDISEISDTEEVNLKESGVMLGLPKCQKESGQNGIEESLKFLSPIVSVSCSSTGLNYSTDAGSPGNSSLTSSDATVSSDSSVTMTTGRFGNTKRKRTKHDLFTLNISREKGEKIITDKNLSKLDDDDDDDDDNSKAYMSDKEDTAEDNEVSYYELRRKPKVDYLGTKISEHYVDSENKSHEDSIKIKALNATSGNSMKNFPVRLHSTFGGRKSLKMKRKLESKRELVESEDFVINVSSSADIAPLEKNTVFTDLESRKETIYSAGYTNVSPTMEHTVNKELLCVKNDATLKDTGSNRRKRRKFSSSAPSLFKEDIRNENLKTDSKGAKYMYDEIELCIGDRESTTEDSEGSAYNLRRRPKVDYCGTKISRYYIDSLNESNKKDNEQTSLHCNRGAVVAHSIYEQRMLERLNNSEDNGKRFNRFDIDDKCMNEKEILLAKREENFYSNLKEDNSSDSLSLTLYEKDTDENLTDIKSHVKMCDKVNVKNKNTNNKGQLLDRRQENPDLNLEERYSSDCLDHISQKDSNEKFTDNESLDSLLLENPFSLDFSSPNSVRRYNRNDIASEQGKDMSGNNSTETLPNGSLLKQIVSDLQSENSRDYSEKTDVSETTAEVFPPCRRNIIAETLERNPLYINFIEGKFVGTTTCMESDRYGPTELFPARRNQEQDSPERPIPDMKISDKFMNLDTSGDRVNIPVCEQNNVGTLHSRIISNENKHTHEHSIDRTVLDGQYLGANTHVEILQENDKCGDKLIAGCCYSKADEKVNSKVTPIEIDNKEPTDSIDTNGNYAESLHYFDTSSDMKHVDSVLGEGIEQKYQNQTLVQTTLDKFFTVVKNVPSTLFADAQTEQKTQSADTLTEMKTHYSDGQTEKKALSADTRTEKKAQSADTQTEMETQSADAQTEMETQSADAQTEQKTQSADTQTEKKTQTADTEKKAQSADAQTKKKALSADAQTEMKTLSADAQTEKKTQSADTQSKKKTQSPDTHTEKKTQSVDTQTEKKTQSADAQTKKNGAEAVTSNLGPKTRKEKIFENYLHQTSQYRVKSVSATSTERDVVTKNAFDVNEHNSYIDGSCKFTVEADSSVKESSSFQEEDCIIENDKHSCGLESMELDNVDSSEAVEGGKDVEPDSSVPILEQGDTNNNFSKETLPEIEFMEVSDVEKTATSNTEVDKNQEKLKKERSMNEYHEKCKKADFLVGEIVWGRFGKAWWPALVVSGEIVKRATKKGYIWLYWLSDHKISQVKLLDVDPFQNKFNTRCKEKRKHNMQYGIEKALEICAYRANVDMGEFGSIEDWTKSDKGFLHIKAKRFRPDPEYPVPNYVLKDLKGMPDSVQLPVAPCNQNVPAKHLGSTGQDGVSTNIDPGSSGLINPVVHEWNAADQSYNDLDVDETDLVCVNEKICIACSTEVTDGYNHPLFEGKICGKCKETLKESFYAVDDDGCSMFCDVCGEGGDLYVCSNNDCGKAYCFSCVEKHTSRATMKKIEETKYWKCFLCTAYSRQSHGNLIPHKEWSLEVVKFFQTNRVSMCSDLQYLKNSGRRKLRVLSLFDGIGSGKVALDELGLDVDVYYASEINPDALLVANFHHCPTQLGNIWDLSPAKLEELCPIDLVLAGPPCNDLSIVNPDRKGFGGTGILVWRFVAVLKDIQMICKSTNHVFWLMENTASMLTEYRKVISKQFEMEPVVWDAKHFTGQRRARNFWGNIPGMFSAPRFCKQLEKDKKDLNFALISNCNRTARVSHTRTITSSSNSLSITNGANNPVVSMNGEPDHIWVQELERLFGFPIHYTDVGQLTLERRRKLIGKAWSVPVIKHLLSPLKQYFKVKDK